MLRQLPRCWNWEVALLHGFASQFPRMLDVEKKWSVDVLAFTVQDASRVWSRVQSLDRLDQILSIPVQVRVAADRLPQRETLTLQQVLTTWDTSAQIPVVQQKRSQLQFLRYNCSPELIPLVDSYCRSLAVYLQKREQASRSPETRMQSPEVSASVVAHEACKELELLDKRRDAFRPEKILSVNSPISH